MALAVPSEGDGGWLERRADEISQMLRCPVTIEDTEHRVLAYSMHEQNADAIRIATIIGRRVPEHVVRSLREKGVIRRLQREDGPIRIEAMEEIGLGARAAVSVRSGGRVVGYIWAAETDRPPDESDMDKLRRAAESIAGELHRRNEVRWRSDFEQGAFLVRLVEGRFLSDEEIRAHAEGLGRPLPEIFRMAAIDFDLEPSSLWPLLRRSVEILEEEPGVCRLTHAAIEGRLVFLAGMSSARGSKRGWRSSLERLEGRLGLAFPGRRITVGAGSIKDNDYTLASDSYREAIKTIEVRKRFPGASGSSLSYEELGYAHFLPAVAETIRTERITNVHVALLREYDRKHQTDLTYTLSVLLACDCSVREAAERLHVHPNTLSYRIARMNEISGIDLKNMADKVAAFLYLHSGG
ncbi:transcriptional activator AdeR [Cohnella xylanilytica]|uniref:Helix-turn-helix domain-containing protein n=1 Tax=Cohnella xylanilytica TaxID=557555 RepID=A0A841TYR6_9BACL|nr:helix-turn-helix domain-containing protein [Cohnella xylanilytica]MBB6693697.1 helix-turn-helix domain-containing protein [Cohnella xylanilytica]GIO15198.1 transcriptional activator AdeR [Cohnella xylanilytica]